ncbi:GD11188 [Drosophila simulans]|uniref:GD11188 n=1 Tax=Drosophila simulans TaxID=7240 RepID=B4QHX8_DROSI|nr:GD11188 [Drosophila simulans]
MAFQLPTTTAAPTGGASSSFSFGLSTGTPAAAPAAGTATTVPATKTTFSFGTPAPAACIGGGDADNTKAQAPPAFGFGLTSGTASAPLTLGTQAANLASTTSATATGTSAAPAAFGGFTAQPAASVVPTIATSAPNTAATTTGLLGGSGLGAPKTTAAAPTTLTAAPASIAPTQGAAPAPTLSTGGAFANLTTETKTTDSSAVSAASQLSYHQLEEHINKWTLEFEEQEKVFTEQATQINAWDKLLISNNQKIVELNDAVKKVKTDQQVLDQELEFIATQQKELEDSLGPLEKEFVNLPRVDMERSQTYLMDTTDPIIQIGKVDNAHMNSLQWIEWQSTNISKKLEDIGKIQDSQKRDIFRAPF